jgi:hypothetical protein
MQKIKLFLASSSELKEDQDQFEIFIYHKCKAWFDRGIFLPTSRLPLSTASDLLPWLAALCILLKRHLSITQRLLMLLLPRIIIMLHLMNLELPRVVASNLRMKIIIHS